MKEEHSPQRAALDPHAETEEQQPLPSCSPHSCAVRGFNEPQSVFYSLHGSRERKSWGYKRLVLFLPLWTGPSGVHFHRSSCGFGCWSPIDVDGTGTVKTPPSACKCVPRCLQSILVSSNKIDWPGLVVVPVPRQVWGCSGGLRSAQECIWEFLLYLPLQSCFSLAWSSGSR